VYADRRECASGLLCRCVKWKPAEWIPRRWVTACASCQGARFALPSLWRRLSTDCHVFNKCAVARRILRVCVACRMSLHVGCRMSHGARPTLWQWLPAWPTGWHRLSAASVHRYRERAPPHSSSLSDRQGARAATIIIRHSDSFIRKTIARPIASVV
jgi:hypothetical protein